MAWEPSAKHAWRRHINQKHKLIDRAHGKTWKHPAKAAVHNERQFRLWVRDVLRVKAPPETGYGVAYAHDKARMLD